MRDKLFGLWQLALWEVTNDKGEVRAPLGEEGSGYLFYLPNEYMSVHLMSPTFLDFKNVAFNQQAELTDVELQKFMGSYFSYTGKYHIDAQSVHHHLEMCSIPSLIGTTLTRDYQLKNDQLTLTHKIEFTENHDDSKLIWHKVKD